MIAILVFIQAFMIQLCRVQVQDDCEYTYIYNDETMIC